MDTHLKVQAFSLPTILPVYHKNPDYIYFLRSMQN